MPRTWVEWKHEASILNNQWRQFNATHPQMMMSKNPATPTTTPMHSATLLLHLPPLHPLLAHPCPLPPAASWLQTHNPWTWIVWSLRTHLRPVTTVTSQGTSPGTVQNPMHIECTTQTPCLQRPSKQSWKP